MKILAIYDKKIHAYMNPFVAQTNGAGIRAFQDGVKDPQTPMGLHPEDYSLNELATFNPESGEITPLDRPTQIATALQFIE